jgi:malate synthase
MNDIPVATVAPGCDTADDLLTADVLALIGTLQRVHGHSLRTLLDRRTEPLLALDPATEDIRRGDWTVNRAPADLTDRRVEITGPADRKMIIGALNSGARVFMADLEDSLSPTWENVVDGHRNLRDAFAGTLTFTRPDGAVDAVADDPATLTVRGRGLHLDEPRVLMDGRPVAAALFDVTVAAANGARYFYLPKLQGHREAEWWDAVLADVERRLALPHASLRVTVLIETLPAAFAMDEILHALRERITGLNAGRWDYLFSIIKVLGTDPAHVLPDRGSVTMTVPFLAAYAERLVATCHRRGAHAIGGMAAFVPNRRDPEATERALAAVRADKEREAALGYDGTWVAHPDLVPAATGVFDAVLGDRPHQLDVVPARPAHTHALVDTAVPGARATRAGLINDVSVSLQYLAAWLAGRGAVAINDLMEDAATAEIARSQLWQWIHHGTALDDGTAVTRDLVADAFALEHDRLLNAGHDPDHLKVALAVLEDVTFAEELPDFLTTAAQPHLA